MLLYQSFYAFNMDTSSKDTVYIIKIINVGMYRVGKTSLAVRYTQNKFQVNYLPTLGVDFYSKMIDIDEDTKIKLVLFDTVGQERLATLRKRYYAGAHGAVVVYDVTRRETFESLDYWINEVIERCSNIPMVIVGNKTDLIEKREVKFEEAQRRWKDSGYTVLESSAKMGTGVDDIYTIIAKKVIRQMEY